MPSIKDLLEFPTIYTFKIIGQAGHSFTKKVKKIFADKKEATFVELPSKKGNYIGLSVTTDIETYEELERIYKAISQLKEIKFYI